MAINISSYHVQNILRVYNKQARLQGSSTRFKNGYTQLPMDEVSVSDEAKKRQILKQVTSQVVDEVMTRATKDEKMTGSLKGNRKI